MAADKTPKTAESKDEKKDEAKKDDEKKDGEKAKKDEPAPKAEPPITPGSYEDFARCLHLVERAPLSPNPARGIARALRHNTAIRRRVSVATLTEAIAESLPLALAMRACLLARRARLPRSPRASGRSRAAPALSSRLSPPRAPAGDPRPRDGQCLRVRLVRQVHAVRGQLSAAAGHLRPGR